MKNAIREGGKVSVCKQVCGDETEMVWRNRSSMGFACQGRVWPSPQALSSHQKILDRRQTHQIYFFWRLSGENIFGGFSLLQIQPFKTLHGVFYTKSKILSSLISSNYPYPHAEIKFPYAMLAASCSCICLVPISENAFSPLLLLAWVTPASVRASTISTLSLPHLLPQN